jgi:hypothetical protein
MLHQTRKSMYILYMYTMRLYLAEIILAKLKLPSSTISMRAFHRLPNTIPTLDHQKRCLFLFQRMNIESPLLACVRALLI